MGRGNKGEMSQKPTTLTPGPGITNSAGRNLARWYLWQPGESSHLTSPNWGLWGEQAPGTRLPRSQEEPATQVLMCYVPISKCWQPIPLFVIQTLLTPTVWTI
jgi:hypothetical protein